MDNYDSTTPESQEAHRTFLDKTIAEFNSKKEQQTFGTPDTELMKPAIDEIVKGKNVRAFVVAVELKDGTLFSHKSQGSEKLMKRLNGDD